MARVIVHHAHHPDEGDGVYRLIHAEQEEVTVYDFGDPQPAKATELRSNPDFVEAPPEGEEDDRTELQKQPAITVEVDVDGPPKLIERTDLVHFDHREVVWAADDERWKGMSDEAIADAQRDDVRRALHGVVSQAGKEAKAAERQAEAAKPLSEPGVEL